LAIGDAPFDVEVALRLAVMTGELKSVGRSEEILIDAGAPWVFAGVKECFEGVEWSPLND
jgi:hypothetical protein